MQSDYIVPDQIANFDSIQINTLLHFVLQLMRPGWTYHKYGSEFSGNIYNK